MANLSGCKPTSGSRVELATPISMSRLPPGKFDKIIDCRSMHATSNNVTFATPIGFSPLEALLSIHVFRLCRAGKIIAQPGTVIPTALIPRQSILQHGNAGLNYLVGGPINYRSDLWPGGKVNVIVQARQLQVVIGDVGDNVGDVERVTADRLIDIGAGRPDRTPCRRARESALRVANLSELLGRGWDEWGPGDELVGVGVAEVPQVDWRKGGRGDSHERGAKEDGEMHFVSEAGE